MKKYITSMIDEMLEPTWLHELVVDRLDEETEQPKFKIPSQDEMEIPSSLLVFPKRVSSVKEKFEEGDRFWMLELNNGQLYYVIDWK